MVPGEDHDLRGLGELLLGDLEERSVSSPDARVVSRVFFYRPLPPIVLGNRYPGVHLLGSLSRLAGRDGVPSARYRDEKDVNLAQDFELCRREVVAKVSIFNLSLLTISPLTY